ncbi:hypothetical protein BDV28DRAFT_67025 [Aspergillus coremiiformis]|uniref:Uncharacterized protein n=1 Tax=Aspergillus coremiiformis TaxID=138285 RepID=A0A5N6YUQ9_9EURO|nr:hypothetical protein BDV28DRAFT_67025 [Aspergillus coremiiformis]
MFPLPQSTLHHGLLCSYRALKCSFHTATVFLSPPGARPPEGQRKVPSLIFKMALAALLITPFLHVLSCLSSVLNISFYLWI